MRNPSVCRRITSSRFCFACAAPASSKALAAPAVVSAAQFEGKIAFKMTSARGQSQDIVYEIKGDKLRIEMPAMAR